RAVLLVLPIFFFYCPRAPRDLHSFPTRRSSDLATLAVLEDCLADFPGAVLLVTHDRYFLDRVTNQILAFDKDDAGRGTLTALAGDRKSTRLNSSHVEISYAVFCLKKKKKTIKTQ